MEALFQFCVRRPRAVLAAAGIVTLAAAPGIARLHLRTDGHALVPRDDPAIVYDAEVRRAFGIKDQIVVTLTVESAPDVFNPRTLALLRDLSARFAALEGVGPDDVVSLATEKRDRVRTGTLHFLQFLEPFPETPEALEQLRGDVRVMRILHGTLVSFDERSAAILVGAGTEGDRLRLYRDILATIERTDTGGHRVRVVGAPVAESLLGRHIIDDLSVLVPVVVAVIAALIFWQTRSAWAVGVVMAEVGSVLVFTFGVMGYAGVPVYLTMAILPVSLTAVGVADDIHIFNHYQQMLERAGESGPAGPLVVRTMTGIARPILLTSLTTAIGFLSFTSATIVPVQAFGVFECVGVLFAGAWSFTATPAMLSMISPARILRRRDVAPETAGRSPTLARLAGRLLERRMAFLGLIAVGLAVTPLGIGRLFVQDSWIEGFAPGSDFRLDTAFVNEHFCGTHILTATVETGPAAGRLLEPDVLERIGGLEAFVRELPTVGGVLGPQTHLSTVYFLLAGRKEDYRRTPPATANIRRAIEFMERIRGQRRRQEVIDDARQNGLITIFLKNANYIDTRRVMDGIRDYERRELAPHGMRVRFAGDVGVSQAMIPAIVVSQVRSLLLSLAGVWLLATLMSRSLTQGFCCVIPAVLAVGIVFAAMGFVGMPLGVATSMFCAITLGIGVDYGIHLVERARLLAAEGRESRGALVEAAATSGRAMTIDAVAIAVGFGVLLVSQVPANMRLGGLVALSIGACYVLTLGGLTALLDAWRPRFARPPAGGTPGADGPPDLSH